MLMNSKDFFQENVARVLTSPADGWNGHQKNGILLL